MGLTPTTSNPVITATACVFLNEVICYGGLPLTRADVYAVCLRDTGEGSTAGLFAFSRKAKQLTADAMTIAEFDAAVLEAHSGGVAK